MGKQTKAPPRFYLGLTDGTPHCYRGLEGNEFAELFRSRAAARRTYEDVQEVRLVLVSPKKRKARR